MGVSRPRVALLSNGEEPTKGTEAVVAAHAALSRADSRAELRRQRRGLHDRPTGDADVVVTDGFTGNVMLKVMEGTSKALLDAIRDAASSSARAKAGGLLLRPALRGLRDEIDPEASAARYCSACASSASSRTARFAAAGIANAIAVAARGVRERRRRAHARGARGGGRAARGLRPRCPPGL